MNNESEGANVELSAKKAIAGSLLVISFFYLLVRYISNLNTLILSIILFVIAVVIALPMLYSVTMRITHRNSVLTPVGWVYWLLSSRGIAVMAVFCWGLLTSYTLLIKMSFFRAWEWWFLLSMFPTFWLTLYLVNKSLRNRTAILYRHYFNLKVTSLVFPSVVALVYAMIPINSGAGFEQMKLSEAMNSGLSEFAPGSNSAFVTDSLFLYNLIDTPQKWISANQAGFTAAIVSLLSIGAIWVLAFNISQILAFFVLPKQELKRVFAPISDSLLPMPVSGRRVIYLSTIVTLFFFFIYIRGFSYLELSASQNPSYATFRSGVVALQTRLIELIDAQPYAEGTVAAIDTLRNQIISSNKALVSTLHDPVNIAYDSMEENVDKFLDEYYKVSADWVRVGKTFTGKVDDYLKELFVNKIVNTQEAASMERRYEEAIASNSILQSRFEVRRAEILRQNKLDDIDLDDPSIEITRTATISEFDFMTTGLDSELTARGGASAVSGVLAGKLTAKLATKTSFKAAASLLAKAAGKPVAGAVGATIGGSIGSVTPVAGTVIGAVIGGAIGVAVDTAVLKLEERNNRDDFRRQIIETLCESRVETLESLKAPDDKFPSHCAR